MTNNHEKPYVVMDGQEIELTDELRDLIRERLGIKSDSPFDRQGLNEPFYYINERLIATGGYDCHYMRENQLYEVGNYCADGEMMTLRAQYEQLHRLLWRFAGGFPANGTGRYRIVCNGNNVWVVARIDSHDDHAFGEVLFDDADMACRALNEVFLPFLEDNPELEEYLSEIHLNY